jgi:protein transport protein SEC13
MFPAHGLGVNAVSWGSSSLPGATMRGSNSPAIRRFVTGGSDNAVKMWEYSNQTSGYVNTLVLPDGHADWVRDVAWSPTLLNKSYIASASQDKTVRIWTQAATPQGVAEWKLSKRLDFEAVLWRVSWSLSGNVLAVSGGDNKVTLWKENLKGEWSCVREVTE